MDATLPISLAAVPSQAGQQSGTLLTLQPGAMLRLRRVRGLKLQVQAGRIWLTYNGGLDDHFLEAGQGLAMPGSARDVLIECDGGQPARLQFRT